MSCHFRVILMRPGKFLQKFLVLQKTENCRC